MDLGFGCKQSISFEGDSGWKYLRIWELNLSFSFPFKQSELMFHQNVILMKTFTS